MAANMSQVWLDAIRRNDVETARRLVQQDRFVLQETNPVSDGTALHFSACNDFMEMTKFLITKGANPNDKNSEGQTALMLSADDGSVDMVNYLISKGADVNVRDNEGWTALHYAAREGSLEVLEMLVEAGVCVLARDIMWRRAIDLAVMRNHEECADFLEAQEGADLGNPGTDAYEIAKLKRLIAEMEEFLPNAFDEGYRQGVMLGEDDEYCDLMGDEVLASS